MLAVLFTNDLGQRGAAQSPTSSPIGAYHLELHPLEGEVVVRVEPERRATEAQQSFFGGAGLKLYPPAAGDGDPPGTGLLGPPPIGGWG